ncbi:MAG TPA: acyl-CoA dehydrogenase [Thermohalobaculum sp.]|nr:acyl-CoA dehydrogenase [Thermohalobaculum sp.]
MGYRAPTAEMVFTASRVIGQDRLAETERYADATAETRDAILGQAARMVEGVLAPLDRAGDRHPARLENGVVRTSPGFAEGYRAIAEGGWVGMTAGPEHGGMGLPHGIATIVNEMLSSACLSLSLCPLLSQGAIEALERHADPELRALYLPKLVSGEWTGTMNLTEPQAGSDVGALTTRAVPADDGSYRISGQKIYISWGDHDVARNICHLVLARLPDAAPGTRGISLFMVPKYLPDADGAPGPANGVRTVSLEEKLGLHGSPTAVLEYDNATGWLVGPAHGGMAAMFTMMNAARLGVGIEGVAIAEAALQRAVAFALERRQGKTADGTPAIAGHADVRRMLARMAALTRAARALCYDCAFSLDMARAGAEGEAAAHAARAAFLTPLAKAFGTDTGSEVADLGIQVHGGMGFVEETGAAQYLRDVRVTRIYEGTNGIQAMDLVSRKLADGGAAARGLIDEVRATAGRAREAGETAMAEAVEQAARELGQTTERMLAAEPVDRGAGAAPFLRQWALTLGAHYLVKGALEGGDEQRAMAELFVGRVLPEAAALAREAVAGAAPLYAIAPEALAP